MSIMLRATVVGINEYKDEKYRHSARLRFACNDAQEIAKLLQSSTTFTVENVTLLTDKDATKAKVQKSLEATFVSRNADRNTIALFYFAGHGIANPISKRVSLCCHDVNVAEPETGAIRLNDIHDWLASCSAECIIVIIDACFSGGIMAAHVDYRSVSVQAMQAIEMLRYPEGKTIAIFAACRSDEEALERKKLSHGIFTYEILRGWRDGEAREEKEGIVYLHGLVNFLAGDLTKYKQRPQIRFGFSRPIALQKVEQTVASVSTFEPKQSTRQVISETTRGNTSVITSRFKLPEGPHSSQSPDLLRDRNSLFVVLLSILALGLLVLGLVIFFIVHFFIH